MNIVSLKGPAKEDGITAALERLHKAGGRTQSWWYLAQDQIRCQTKSAVRHLPSENIPAQVCDAHYRFCYEFIWPLMHDMADQATYVEEDFFLYKRQNAILVAQIGVMKVMTPISFKTFSWLSYPNFSNAQVGSRRSSGTPLGLNSCQTISWHQSSRLPNRC